VENEEPRRFRVEVLAPRKNTPLDDARRGGE